MRRPEAHSCGEKLCLNCEEYVDPNTHLCYMKPIKFEDHEQEEEEGQGKKKKNKGKRRCLSDEMIMDKVEEDDKNQEKAAQEYLSFDIES